MISASGSNPLERCSGRTLILRVIHLMNDPGPEAVADPALIMPREPHLEAPGGRRLSQEQRVRREPAVRGPPRSTQLRSGSPESLGKSGAFAATPWRTL